MRENSVIEGIVARQRIQILFKELFRKTIHICSAFVPFFLRIMYVPTIILLILAFAGYTICEILRLKGHQVPLISKITEIAARKRDENKFVLGPITLVCGILIAAVFLPWECARIGIFALSFGDGLASLAGKLMGRITIPGAHGKTVAGSLTCFAAVFISSFCCCQNCYLSLILGVAAMFIEMLPLSDLDNVIIPISIGSLYLIIPQIISM